MKYLLILFVASATIASVYAGTACENQCNSNHNYCLTMVGSPSMPNLTKEKCDAALGRCLDLCTE